MTNTNDAELKHRFEVALNKIGYKSQPTFSTTQTIIAFQNLAGVKHPNGNPNDPQTVIAMRIIDNAHPKTVVDCKPVLAQIQAELQTHPTTGHDFADLAKQAQGLFLGLGHHLVANARPSVYSEETNLVPGTNYTSTGFPFDKRLSLAASPLRNSKENPIRPGTVVLCTNEVDNHVKNHLVLVVDTGGLCTRKHKHGKLVETATADLDLSPHAVRELGMKAQMYVKVGKHHTHIKFIADEEAKNYSPSRIHWNLEDKSNFTITPVVNVGTKLANLEATYNIMDAINGGRQRFSALQPYTQVEYVRGITNSNHTLASASQVITSPVIAATNLSIPKGNRLAQVDIH